MERERERKREREREREKKRDGEREREIEAYWAWKVESAEGKNATYSLYHPLDGLRVFRDPHPVKGV